MRFSSFIAALAVAFALTLGATAPAAAFGWKKSHCHHHHKGKDHRAVYHCHGRDPYAYRYETRGYYPYYKSDYWRSAHRVRRLRRSFRMPRYYAAWGHYKRHYNHKRWHKRHHGGHRFYYW